MSALLLVTPALVFVGFLAWAGLVLEHEEHKRLTTTTKDDTDA